VMVEAMADQTTVQKMSTSGVIACRTIALTSMPSAVAPALPRATDPTTLRVVEIGAAPHAGHDVDELVSNWGGGLGATRERADSLESSVRASLP